VFDNPVTVATFKSGDWGPLEEVVPQPLMVNVVPAKVWLTSSRHVVKYIVFFVTNADSEY
jgi:hypothetical protein